MLCRICGSRVALIVRLGYRLGRVRVLRGRVSRVWRDREEDRWQKEKKKVTKRSKFLGKIVDMTAHLM